MILNGKPTGFHTITPNIIAEDAGKLIAFLVQAFGAVENYRLTLGNGSITHCELRLGDSILNVGQSTEGWPPRALIAQIYVENSDALFERVVAAGAQVIMPITDMFFGSREGHVKDPFGNTWVIATMKEQVTPAEMQRRMRDLGY
jgi:PhnB protein